MILRMGLQRNSVWGLALGSLKNKCNFCILAEIASIFEIWSLLEPHGRLDSQMPPRCLPDASQMPPRSLPEASHMPPRCLPMPPRMPLRCLSNASSLNYFFSMILFSMIPPQGSLLYHRASNESPSMIPLDLFLFHDSSNGFTKKLFLVSRAGVKHGGG